MRISDWSSDVCSSDLFGEIARPAERAHLLIGFEQGLQSDRTGHHVAVDEAQHGFIDAPVERRMEMFGLELDLNVFDEPVVDHQRAKQRAFRLDVLREGGGHRQFFGNETDRGCEPYFMIIKIDAKVKQKDSFAWGWYSG